MPCVNALLLLSLAQTSSSAPGEAPLAASTTVSHLERGLQLLDNQEIETARAELELARLGGPYSYAQVVSLYRSLGIARAYDEDEAAAAEAFTLLLAVAPGETLPYTISPKATFVFDRARQQASSQRALRVRLGTDPVVAFDQPVRVVLQRTADPRGLLRRLTLLYRLKGEAQYTAVPVALDADRPTAVELPPVPAARATPREDGTPGALLELALIGHDAQGWEIYREPEPERPAEVPVGFEPPGPWYTQWWLWGGVAGVAAALISGGVVAALLWPPPDTVAGTYLVTTP